MAKNNLVLVVVVALVIAVVVSVATVSLTGDVVIRQGFGKKTEVTTKQEVLNMLRTYSPGGGCGYSKEPIGSLWDVQDDDYSFTQQYIAADNNGDGITTGIEWCSSLGGTCISGYSLVWISTQDYSGFLMNNPIGCAGGTSYNDLKSDKATHNTYLCCKS